MRNCIELHLVDSRRTAALGGKGVGRVFTFFLCERKESMRDVYKKIFRCMNGEPKEQAAWNSEKKGIVGIWDFMTRFSISEIVNSGINPFFRRNLKFCTKSSFGFGWNPTFRLKTSNFLGRAQRGICFQIPYRFFLMMFARAARKIQSTIGFVQFRIYGKHPYFFSFLTSRTFVFD